MNLLSRSQTITEPPPAPYSGQRWEYTTLNLNFKASVKFEDAFNELGQQGWEFVAMATRDAIGKDVHRAIFKRPL